MSRVCGMTAEAAESGHVDAAVCERGSLCTAQSAVEVWTESLHQRPVCLPTQRQGETAHLPRHTAI